MEFNVQRIGDYWISGFRNVRHAHVFIYPLILLLTGYLVALWAKLGWAAAACCVALVAAAWQSVSAAKEDAGGVRRRARGVALPLDRPALHHLPRRRPQH